MIFSKEALINFDPNIENQKILHINRLDPRATVIPAQKAGVYYRNKEESSHIRSLNGDYKFLYLLEDVKKDFYKEDENDADWDTIDVPSMWQYRGYGTPEYPNIRYSIPFLPPYVKKQNPVGHYKKKFIVENPAEKTILLPNRSSIQPETARISSAEKVNTPTDRPTSASVPPHSAI